MIIIGIDPGVTGAMAVIEKGQLTGLMPMMASEGRVSGSWIALQLSSYKPDYVVVEDVHAMPRNGSVASFKLGYNYGVIVGVVQSLSHPLVRVSPQKWKRTYSLTGKGKDASRFLAQELYPSHAGDFRLKKDDGKAEAALIARWGLGHVIQTGNHPSVPLKEEDVIDRKVRVAPYPDDIDSDGNVVWLKK